MGNDQSGDRGGGISSPTTSTGVPTSFSFLAKKRNSTKSGGMANSIVVVNEGAGSSSATDPTKDPDLLRIKEIPNFFPLLRGVLPGYRDPPEVHQKIDHKHILHFLHRLQHHLRHCAHTVATEQGRMFARVVEIDQLITSLLKKTATSTKRMDVLSAELRRTDSIKEQLESAQVMLQELVQSADSLNQLLPAEDRLLSPQLALTPILTRRKLAEDVEKTMCNRQTTTGAANSMQIEARKVSETRVVDRK